jgi:hypothetical protein
LEDISLSLLIFDVALDNLVVFLWAPVDLLADLEEPGVFAEEEEPLFFNGGGFVAFEELEEGELTLLAGGGVAWGGEELEDRLKGGGLDVQLGLVFWEVSSDEDEEGSLGLILKGREKDQARKRKRVQQEIELQRKSSR